MYLLQVFAETDVALQLAINTAQYGRTFQDRTHVFAVRPKPEGTVEGQSIINMNVSLITTTTTTSLKSVEDHSW